MFLVPRNLIASPLIEEGGTAPGPDPDLEPEPGVIDLGAAVPIAVEDEERTHATALSNHRQREVALRREAAVSAADARMGGRVFQQLVLDFFNGGGGVAADAGKGGG